VIFVLFLTDIASLKFEISSDAFSTINLIQLKYVRKHAFQGFAPVGCPEGESNQ
jgi:hypothetical protein